MEINAATVESRPGFPPPTLRDAELDPVHGCTILIIDDEEPNVRLLERLLTRAGFENFISTTDSRDAAALFADLQPDLVLTDWLMPEVNGCDVIKQLGELTATDDYLPIVVLTADITPETRRRALAAGATDFLTKPFDQIEVLLRIRNLLQARLSHLTVQKQKASLEQSVRHRTIELEQALEALKRNQRQVIQQERLAALGTMAGGIAHDFNNALGIIMGFGELLLRDLEEGLTKENATEPITTILTAAEDAAQIVSRLRDFYRVEESEEQRLPVDLQKLIAQAVLLTQPRWKTAAAASGRIIRIKTEPGQIPFVEGDAAELREVLTNLIFNGVDALPNGGTITFRTLTEGDFVVVKISDTGTGMTEEVRRQCLEPFFTTKGARGTGLGLSMVFGIIQRHGGTLDVESPPGEGATFVIRLPVGLTRCAQIPIQVPASHESLRILVVDDQPILCQLLCQHLQDDLHTVEIAHSGSAALAKFREGQFDLVITDQVMSEMTGEQLAIALRELDPKIPIILLTGYAGEGNAEKHYAKAINLVLGKPLSRAALRRALAKVMTVV